MGDVKLDRAYIGSCTGGKTSDFLEFARVLRGKRVSIDTFGVPATPMLSFKVILALLAAAGSAGIVIGYLFRWLWVLGREDGLNPLG